MELLIDISMYLSYLLEGYIAYVYFAAMFERKSKNLIVGAAAYTAGFSLLYGVFLLNNSALNLLSAVVIMTLLGIHTFDAGWLKALFHSGVVAVLLVASETLIIALYNIVFSVNAASINTPGIIVIVSISSKLLLFLLCRCIAFFAVKDSYNNNWSLLLFLVPVSSLLCMLIMFYQSARLTLSIYENILGCVTAMLLLVANMLVFYVYERTLKNEHELAQIKLSEQRTQFDYDYYKMLEETRNESQIIIHDFKHHLSLIRSMAGETGNTEAVRYVDSILTQPYFRKSALLSGNKIVDAILAQKSSVCAQNNIGLTLEHNNVDIGFVSDFDLCSIMSNTLDNAIEAAMMSKERIIYVKLYRSENGNFYFLEIMNSCDRQPKKGYKSTKHGKYHGIGLYSVRQTVERYNGDLNLEYLQEEGRFRTTVMLQRPE